MVGGGARAGVIASRVLAATVGAYGCVYAAVAAAARLPLVPGDAILYPALLAIPVHVALSMWAFAARRVALVWLALGAASAACAAFWAWAGAGR